MSKESAYQFYCLVKRMRESQREYFKTRSQDALTRSKTWENEVDTWIKRSEEIINKQPQQPNLFDQYEKQQ